MLKKIYLISFIFFFTFIGYSQTTLTLQDKTTLPAAQAWAFKLDSYNYATHLDVQIGNNGKGGTIKLEIKASNKDFFIGGNVYLFLEDGSVITCTDKNKRFVTEETIQSFYILTPNEINLLKRKKITDVHFKIVGNETQFSSNTGYFTAENKIKTYGFPDKYFNTVDEITQLFKK